MTLLKYGADDIRAWAEFSGDFNPVHFDLSVAARLGLPQIPVHGMRVMLDVKSEAYRHLLEQQNMRSEPLLFKATLRAPVLRDSSYRLRIVQKDNQCGFTVIDDNDGKTCISGHLHPTVLSETAGDNALPRVAREAVTSSQTQTDLMDAVGRFMALSDDSQPPWILLDALLFRHLLLHRGPAFADIGRALGADNVTSVSALIRSATILQTRHATLVAPIAHQLTLDAFLEDVRVKELCFEIDQPESAGDASSGLVIHGSLAARLDDTLLTRTSVGLLALPPRSFPQ